MDSVASGGIVSSSQILDLLLAGFLILGLLVGVAQGMLRQGILLASLYIATLWAAQYYTMVSTWVLGAMGGDPVVISAIAAGSVFVVAMVALNWLARSIYRQTALPSLAWADRAAGGVLGIAGSWVFLGLTLTLLGFGASVPWGPWEEQRILLSTALGRSTMAPAVAATIPTIFETMRPWLPLGLPAVFSSIGVPNP